MSLTREERKQRKQIRYLCFRIKNQNDGGAKAPKGSKKFQEQFSADPWFSKMGGWSRFGIDWDISKQAPFCLVPLKNSLWEQWEETCVANSIELPRVSFKPNNKKSAIEIQSEQVVELDVEI